jgi:hypothetical protein
MIPLNGPGWICVRSNASIAEGERSEPSTSRLSGWSQPLAGAENVPSFGASAPVGAGWRWPTLTAPLTRAVSTVVTVERLYPVN